MNEGIYIMNLAQSIDMCILFFLLCFLIIISTLRELVF